MTAPTLTDMKYYIVVPQYGVNYVKNPVPYAETTGYTAVNNASIALSEDDDGIYARRAGRCLQVTVTDTLDGVYYDPVPVTDTGIYIFSVDVLNETADEDMSIYIANDSGTAKGTTTFTSTGYWQRKEVYCTADATNASWRLYVMRDAGQGAGEFYIDGLQFEAPANTDLTATTFFWGYSQGFGLTGQREYWWGGSARASYSYRSGLTRSGGRLLDISDYATVARVAGLGMGNFKQVYTDLVSGGAYYQKHIRKPRNISMILHYTGSMSDIQDDRNAILDAVRPDYSGYEQPMILRYQGFDSTGLEATNPVDIKCVFQTSHTDPAQECAFNEDILNFTVLDGYLSGAFSEGIELDQYQDLAVEYIVMRDKDGAWDNMDGGLSGGAVEVIKEAPNGDIYVGGGFTNAGSVAEADRLAKWDGSAWDDVTGAADFTSGSVSDICFDADGNAYIVGSFENVGDANGDRIVKWDGSSLSSLGTGGDDNTVLCIAIESDTGDIYVGGTFTGMGGVANTANIAYWDVSATAWKALSTGGGGWAAATAVYAIAFAPNGDLYIGGDFTGIDGVDGDYIGYWDGTAFNMIGDTEIGGIVRDLAFDENGYLYIAGLFTNAGGDANADYVAKFSGNAWGGLGAGLNGNAYVVYCSGSDVYVAGTFTSAGEITLTDRVAKYSNGAWSPLDIDLPGTTVVQAFLIDSSLSFYLGGAFTTVGEDPDENAVTGKVAVNIANNTGTANTYPFMQITGPGTLQSIYNYSTGRQVVFDGLVIQEGEWINLNFDPANLKFESGWPSRGNLMRYVNEGSDYGNFYLTPGTNYISLFMPTGTGVNTDSTIRWTPRFWSIEGAKFS